MAGVVLVDVVVVMLAEAFVCVDVYCHQVCRQFRLFVSSSCLVEDDIYMLCELLDDCLDNFLAVAVLVQDKCGVTRISSSPRPIPTNTNRCSIGLENHLPS